MNSDIRVSCDSSATVITSYFGKYSFGVMSFMKLNAFDDGMIKGSRPDTNPKISLLMFDC